uniref:uncharacterized protein LOC120338504 n=1 Tax=Styela clava TaxID=7725 RepID=UPI0019393EA5|nr:uncharacterized protein LOC120338504 [Styela clava]
MKISIFFVVTVLVLSSLNTVSAGKRQFPSRFRDIICRRCWQRMFSHCKGGVRMVKRSVDDTNQFKELDAKLKMSKDTTERNWLSRVRRDVNSRRKRGSARRHIRIRIKSCQVCQELCF